MAPLVRISRLRVIGCVVAAVVAAAPLVRASGSPAGVTVEPRIVEATLAGVSLDRVDVSLRIGLRASRAVTIRSIAFTDAFVGQVPVWIERLHGEWPLAPGQELVVPPGSGPHARPGRAGRRRPRGHRAERQRHGAGQRRSGDRRHPGSPGSSWSARRGRWCGRSRWRCRSRPGRPSWRHLPDSAPTSPTPRSGAPPRWLATGLNRLTGRSALVLRFGGAIAEVTTRYGVEVGGTAARRERRAAGVWWSPGVFCTTREALEPWRYDVGDATALQLGGGRLQREGGTVHLGATREHHAVELALSALAPVLPSPAERKLHTLVDGHPRRLRLADREAAANPSVWRSPAARRRHPRPPRPGQPARGEPATSAAGTPYDVAAFSSGRSLTIVWTSVSRGPGATLRIATPLHRASFGSPLVADGRIVGLVASPMAAWPAAAVATAAAHARPVPGARARQLSARPLTAPGRGWTALCTTVGGGSLARRPDLPRGRLLPCIRSVPWPLPCS